MSAHPVELILSGIKRESPSALLAAVSLLCSTISLAQEPVPAGIQSIEPTDHVSGNARTTEAYSILRPLIRINIPSHDELLVGEPLVFSGTVSNTSLASLEKVEAALFNIVSRQWLDFSSSSFSSDVPVTEQAELTSDDEGNVIWNLTTGLPQGRYQLNVRAINQDGIRSRDKDNHPWNRQRFFVEGSDTQWPEISFENPAFDGDLLPLKPTLSGLANDAGGSGIARVDAAIKSLSSDLWLSSDEGTFASTRVNLPTQLTPALGGAQQWSLDTHLPAGRYRLLLRAYDNAGNRAEDPTTASVLFVRHFRITGNDTVPPTVVSTRPLHSRTVFIGSSPRFEGVAEDPDSGIERVEFAVKEMETNLWLDPDTDTFSLDSRGIESALLYPSDDGHTVWVAQAHGFRTGRYRLSYRAIDNAGNRSVNDNGGIWNIIQFDVSTRCVGC
ncbi:hypothetical protein ACUNV4_17925 [Granulosicoccus sp. 3-233]|uniref:hypothetical protein n=1 Tax=Granulosicoccus sp. 3-233 TaxID=3417969 RepID=UPI003D349DCD